MFRRFRPLTLCVAAAALAACSESGPTAPAAEAPGSGYTAAPGVLGFSHTGDATALLVAGEVVNPSFELNDMASTLVGWSEQNEGLGGDWYAQEDDRSPLTRVNVDPPTDGEWAAMVDQNGPGTHILFQDILVPAGGTQLSFDLQLHNGSGVYVSPDHLDWERGDNQQFRADITSPASAPEDTGAGVLLELYRTQPGDGADLPYFTVTADLSAFAGQVVRLRFAEVDNLGPFQVGVENVRLESLDPSTKDDCRKGGFADYGFRNQGQCVRFVETGKDDRL